MKYRHWLALTKKKKRRKNSFAISRQQICSEPTPSPSTIPPVLKIGKKYTRPWTVSPYSKIYFYQHRDVFNERASKQASVRDQTVS